MPRRKTAENEVPPAEETKPEPKGRQPSPARQTLLDADDGKETVQTFETPALAKSSAYGWWGARRRAGLTDKVAISLDTKAMTVTIGPRVESEKAAESTSETGTPHAASAAVARDA